MAEAGFLENLESLHFDYAYHFRALWRSPRSLEGMDFFTIIGGQGLWYKIMLYSCRRGRLGLELGSFSGYLLGKALLVHCFQICTLGGRACYNGGNYSVRLVIAEFPLCISVVSGASHALLGWVIFASISFNDSPLVQSCVCSDRFLLIIEPPINSFTWQ